MSSSDPKKVLNKVLSKAALYLLISLGIYLILMFLAVIIHVLFGIEYYQVEYEYLKRIDREYEWRCISWWFVKTCGWVEISATPVYGIGVANIDIPTYILVGAIDLILNVFVSILVGLAAIFVWAINAFIIGVDENGVDLLPISLFKLIAIIPIIGDWFGSIVGISESLILDLKSTLDIFITTMHGILTSMISGLSGLSNDIVTGFLGRKRTAVIPDAYLIYIIKNYLNWSVW